MKYFELNQMCRCCTSNTLSFRSVSAMVYRV